MKTLSDKIEKQVFKNKGMSPHILLVDDDATQLKLFSALMKKQNYSVVTAKSAEKAKELLQTLHIDLVVTDVHLPEKNGKELIKDLRNSSGLQKLPVISFSIGKDLDDEMLASGATKHFHKMNVRGLLDGISGLLENDERPTSLLAQIKAQYGE